ncbi:alpha/beta hydrolase [Reichenbachiella ulvae]|uniref:Alpha/beta hydrolase n=1 Tax=Reichenbachiella ulvae TaxID=2980104 RepID=A0ABT3D0X6_9BACT|nr:alpha/beta hydrolase [Reichenbachiella ulvae]MCV9389434.1 alpha/beta hydrolase [Reichenbachiella ulvae]
MKVYAISGLGADERVFQNIDIGYELIHLNWIEPRTHESLSSYAQRLAEKIDQGEEFILMGVSFGGILAVEMEQILNPKVTIIISSAQIRKDLNPVFRLIGRTSLLKVLPTAAFQPQPKYVAKLFGTRPEDRAVLNAILEDSDSAFAKWAMNQISQWQNMHRSKRVVMIHGTKDKVMSCPRRSEVLKIEGGGHSMIMDRASEINELIRGILNQHI